MTVDPVVFDIGGVLVDWQPHLAREGDLGADGAHGPFRTGAAMIALVQPRAERSKMPVRPLVSRSQPSGPQRSLGMNRPSQTSTQRTISSRIHAVNAAAVPQKASVKTYPVIFVPQKSDNILVPGSKQKSETAS